MPREVLHYLQLSEGLTVLDGTVGAGGHSSQIVERIGSAGRLIGVDRDPLMLSFSRQKVSASNCTLVQNSYVNARQILDELDIVGADRVLLDLGLSSDQLADRERGFGFDAGGPLDMRFDQSSGRSAAEILNESTAEQLEELFREYGEERQAQRIANEIVNRRKAAPIRTTEELEACVQTVSGNVSSSSRGRNPATRVFQALRIAANDELDHVQRMMTDVLPQIMNANGIAVIITFHSLEDRIVKSAFKGHQGWQVLTKTPVEATSAEVRLNPRSRSAKLRAARWNPR